MEDFGLRIFNPDGSEAEKSGNGLRIFARFLWDERLIGNQRFTIETLGGMVSCEVSADGKDVNVEMGEVRFDSTVIPIEIWERGAGYTLASGSSSTAAAAVAHRLGLCDPDITVHMPGGSLRIQLTKDFIATMTGPVTKICDGVMAGEMFKEVF